MELQNIAVNLRLLCSYVGNVTECSRKIGINRQQFSKYLNGYSQPSMQSLRKICDYFGVDSDEIYLEPELFKKLLSTQPITHQPLRLVDDSPQSQRYSRQLQGMIEHSAQGLERYLGDYYYYYMTPSYPGHISKSFARLTMKNGIGYSHFYERVESGQAMQEHCDIGKFVGVVFLLGERLQIVDYSVHCQRAVSQTILYGATRGNVHLLSGLTMGIQGRNSRIPFTSRVVFEKLSSEQPLKQKLRGVSLERIDDNNLSPAVLSRLTACGSLDDPHIFTAAENY
ncbi:helix-turn-helix transcriptional regulator [Vibrio sp. ABG19]|uniref:helix-turn-helix domain-containing protein n=1 Tax=Vibrio sp. ABG19 TaxID=2817385 RepID=UPI00249F4199|nr:helix-turn-helix transcriptional regulator [Vibrio sp. ABG19]WGY45403.1 helix-turn-helix transcriptional regulator [Vibrio sp. ABG19]